METPTGIILPLLDVGVSQIQNDCSFHIVPFTQQNRKAAMAHSSWQVFSTSRASRTNDPDEVLFMLEEIKTDNETTTDEESDSGYDADNHANSHFANESEPDNTVPDIDS